MTRRSGKPLGRRPDMRPEGPPDPWAQDRLRELESDGKRPQATGMGVMQGPLGLIHGVRAWLGAGFRFRVGKRK